MKPRGGAVRPRVPTGFAYGSRRWTVDAASLDPGPVVTHRNHAAGTPRRVLVGVMRAARLAGDAMEDDPPAGIPVADVEHVARQCAIHRGRTGRGDEPGGQHGVAVSADRQRRRIEQRRRLGKQCRKRVGQTRPVLLAPPLTLPCRPACDRASCSARGPVPAAQQRTYRHSAAVSAGSTKAGPAPRSPAARRRTDGPRPRTARCAPPGSRSAPGARRHTRRRRCWRRPCAHPSAAPRRARSRRPPPWAPAAPPCGPETTRRAATACRRAAPPRPAAETEPASAGP